jgi:hypothetical protein
VKSVNLIAALVIAIGMVLAAAVFALVGDLLKSADGAADGAAVAQLSRDVARYKAEMDAMQSDLRVLRADVEALRAQPPAAAPPATAPTPAQGGIEPGPDPDAPPVATMAPGLDQFGGAAPDEVEETEGMDEPMELAKNHFNVGIQRPRAAVLLELVGNPRESYSDKCLPVTNPEMVKLLETRAIGGFRVTMLKPALDSLEAVMKRLQTEEPDIFAAIGTAGALCARRVRGSQSTISSHAWGAAVDFTLKKNLDQLGDGRTQFGLVVMAEFFNEAGWYWGAGYSREDSMHFEVGEGLLRQWVAEGRL